jgi:hypothetical protein
MKKLMIACALSLGALVSLPAAAGAMSDHLEGALLGHVFKGTAYAGPATTYVGLSTSACSDASTGTEVAGGGYARVAVASNGSSWTGPTANNGTIANAAAVTFPAPTGNWGSVTHWFISDAATAGNLLVCAPLTTPKTINNGDAAPAFGAGALTFQIDD